MSEPLGEHPEMHWVEAVVPLDGHRLRLWFDNGSVREIDIATFVTFRGILTAFQDPDFFRQVTINGGTIAWPNEVDFDPGVLYESATPVDPTTPPHKPPPPLPPAEPPELGAEMPEVSRFFGIVIRMYISEHAPPHFHAVYGGRKISIGIAPPVKVLKGKASPRVLALVREWALLHQVELLENWERARRGEPLQKIAPLE